MLPVSGSDPGFAIYVHWPFCKSKCPYCDFNSHVRERVDHDRWRAGLLRELDHYADLTAGRTVTSIFFGGGTPSLMEPSTVGAIVDRIARRWTVADGLEVTLEANPTSVEADKFRAFRSAGINRVSLGIQALDDTSLKFLGREHNAAEATGAIELAARTFGRFSFDLIYARPGQTVAAWQAELAQALEYAVGHLSVYQLTIEQGTAFYPLHARGDLVLPDDDLAGDLYEATQSQLTAAGLPAYEISNHARPGEESRHNLTYWRYGDYVGIGPGAHGRLTLDGEKFATRAHRAPEIWLERVERDGHGAAAPDPIDRDARGTELLMMGLRLTEGVRLARLTEETGRTLDDVVDPAALSRLIDGGFLARDADRLVATPEGLQRLNAVLGAILT
ncbi:coproporphyrinogen III oxidase [Azospirillum sp. TSH100]|uniref:radical SAM family heme chaperone HemW n=1 Tax=Azospirillum sp. TSH100 TaxID=652764 RepID=UPI000D6090D5|nr:radical SAM family heme chaperone HemW [Azospirillum sp. TSH100]PWC89140.1 coproporphyrinogen III oxidase [Azospirillum sp. TSH100]QCG87064.1 coproporphyrinogen III oxidase [Azospirillum sp. TSH100]